MVGEKHGLSDLTDLVQLTKIVYSGRSITNASYLKWEYADNPFGNAIIYSAKSDDGKIAGQYIVLPTEVRRDKKVWKASLSVNTITHPDFQGLGLFPNLAGDAYEECKNTGIQFTYGFPNSNSFSGFTSKLNFQLVGMLPLYFLAVRPMHIFLHFLFNMKNKKDIQIELRSIAASETVSEVDFEKDVKLLDEFYESFHKRNLITTNRSAQWLKWRFRAIPLRRYKVIKEIKDSKVVSIIVIRAKVIKGVRTGVIVDFISAGHSPEMKKYINQVAKENKIDIFIGTFPFDSVEQKLLSKAGFRKLPDFLMFKKLPFILREHTEHRDEQLFDFKNWFLTFGDYDIF